MRKKYIYKYSLIRSHRRATIAQIAAEVKASLIETSQNTQRSDRAMGKRYTIADGWFYCYS